MPAAAAQPVQEAALATVQTERMGYALRVRMFVQAYIATGFKASDAYRQVVPEYRGRHVNALAYQLLQEPATQLELHRQLRAIEVVGETTIEYLFRQMRSIADTSLLDIVPITGGRVDWEKFNPEALTHEQRLNIREMKFDGKTGRITGMKMASRERAIDMMNQAKGLYEGAAGAQTQVNIAQKLRERMTAAAKRVPAVIDNATGRVIGGSGA